LINEPVDGCDDKNTVNPTVDIAGKPLFGKWESLNSTQGKPLKMEAI